MFLRRMDATRILGRSLGRAQLEPRQIRHDLNLRSRRHESDGSCHLLVQLMPSPSDHESREFTVVVVWGAWSMEDHLFRGSGSLRSASVATAKHWRYEGIGWPRSSSEIRLLIPGAVVLVAL